MIHTGDEEDPARQLQNKINCYDTDIAYFETEEEAFNAASDDVIGQAYGFDVFELGNWVI